MSQSLIPGREPSISPTPTNATNITLIEIDPGDTDSIYKAPRASQVASLNSPRRTRRAITAKRTYTQAQLSYNKVFNAPLT